MKDMAILADELYNAKKAEDAAKAKRIEAEEAIAGGIAIYGEQFGRYPLDPTLAFVMK